MPWRDHIKVHPAAELFPMMSDAELDELAADIKANGLKQQVVLYKGQLLDGRNRLDAIGRAGWELIYPGPKDDLCRGRYAAKDCDEGVWLLSTGEIRDKQVDEEIGDPVAYVISANFHHRRLTAEKKAECIEAVLKLARRRNAHHAARSPGTGRASR